MNQLKARHTFGVIEGETRLAGATGRVGEALLAVGDQ